MNHIFLTKHKDILCFSVRWLSYLQELIKTDYYMPGMVLQLWGGKKTVNVTHRKIKGNIPPSRLMLSKGKYPVRRKKIQRFKVQVSK